VQVADKTVKTCGTKNRKGNEKSRRQKPGCSEESTARVMKSVESALRPEKSLWWERFVKDVGFKAGVKNSYSSLHFALVVDDTKCIVVTRVCVSVYLSVAAACPHYCTDPDVTWGSGRRCTLVVHCWADLQSMHGLRCYGNITRTRNVSVYTVVLALCLVHICSRYAIHQRG